jgi:hypothetical protein
VSRERRELWEWEEGQKGIGQAVKNKLGRMGCERLGASSVDGPADGAALRVLVYERGGIVDLIVNHDVEIFLCGVRRDVGVAEFFGHGEGGFVCAR